MMSFGLVFGVVLLLAGAGLLAAGGVLALRTRAFLARSVTAAGTVVEVVPVSELGRFRMTRTAGGLTVEPRQSFRPVVRFDGPDGSPIEVTTTVFISPAPYRVGDPAAVRYDPADPSQARIDRPLYLWFAPALLSGFGLFAIGMGLLGIALR